MVNSMYKMLIVDDEKIERDCIRYLIDASSLDLDVREASDAEQALQILKDWPADILFTDVQMPSGTGLELAREARCILPNIKTIIFSGHAEFEYAKEAVALGAENYILKPVVPRELAEKVIHRYEASESSVRKEILDVKEYINRNYSANLSVELLASIVYLTPDYLSRLFKKSTGRSISQYIRQVRMERASELLLTTNRKVIDIGAEVGYPNYSYFCQSFREYYGKSPEKYRQEEHHETHT